MTYIAALEVQGFGAWRLCVRHLLPNISSLIVAQGTILFGFAMVDLAAISFLGLGVQTPQADWGVMVSEGKTSLLQGYPLVSLSAVLCIVAVVAAVSFLGDRLDASSKGVAGERAARGPRPHRAAADGRAACARSSPARLARRSPRARRWASSASPAPGKSMTAKAIARLLPTGAECDGQRHLRRHRRPGAATATSCAGTAPQVAVVFQDPRAHINPVRRIEDFMTESLRILENVPEAEAAQPRGGRAGGGRHRRPRQAAAAVPPRAVRRHAAARHDRHRAALRAAAAARRRVHHGARRHHPGRGDGDPRRAAPRPRPVDALHHPRPRARRRGLRPDLRHVRRPGRRDPRGATCCTATRCTPTAPRWSQARPDITLDGRAARGDPRAPGLGVRGAVRAAGSPRAARTPQDSCRSARAGASPSWTAAGCAASAPPSCAAASWTVPMSEPTTPSPAEASSRWVMACASTSVITRGALGRSGSRSGRR